MKKAHLGGGPGTKPRHKVGFTEPALTPQHETRAPRAWSDMAELHQALNARAADLAISLLGRPTASSQAELRFSTMVVTVAGSKAGTWRTRADRGDMLTLIMRVNSCGYAQAFRYARQFLTHPPASGKAARS
jgi:hypothetical protein